MKYKTTIGLILGIFLLAMTPALYGGECTTIDLSGMENPEDLVYTVIGNSTNTVGMNITSNNSIANICFEINYKPDNFTLIFMDKVEKEVIKEVIIYRGGGGGTRTVYEDKNITKYINVPYETIIYQNQSCEKEDLPEKDIKEVKDNFFQRFIEWLRRIFKK